MKELNIPELIKALLVLSTLIVPSTALAGDAAHPEALGFSADGSSFAFSEWGQQDGSGFSYASVFVVDLERDVWLAAPVREMIRDETAAPRSAYTKALSRAEVELLRAGITHPARLVFARDFTSSVGGEATNTIIWKPIAMLKGDQMSHQISLVSFELPSPDCSGEPVGFVLSWNGQEIYRDTKLSQSRGCPTAYSVERVYMPDRILRGEYGVALIGVYRWGFEGPDLRHIAVPIPLK